MNASAMAQEPYLLTIGRDEGPHVQGLKESWRLPRPITVVNAISASFPGRLS